MKRLLPLLFALALIAPSATAAPKTIPVQLGSIFSAPAQTEGLALSGKNAVFFSNINGQSAGIQVTAIDPAGTQVWQRVIDSTYDEVAAAISSDSAGNIWIAGTSAAAPVDETPTSIAGMDNPDQVVIESGVQLRPDMNQLTIWKLTPTGDLATTYVSLQKSMPVISAMATNSSGSSIVGTLDGKPFFISLNAGVFTKFLYIGTSKTELNAVARTSDGGASIFGSSSETLAGKKVAGIRDGILIKVSKSGTITNVVRSSALKASRSWISGDAGHLTSGPVITGKVIESAITKFSPTFTPQWTLRIPSLGNSTTLAANGNSYLALTSKSAITGISGWKPSAPALIILTFDSKGVIKAATALPSLVTPLSLQYSPARGVIGLAAGIDGTVSIFTLVSR